MLLNSNHYETHSFFNLSLCLENHKQMTQKCNDVEMPPTSILSEVGLGFNCFYQKI